MRYDPIDWKDFLTEIAAMIEDPKYAFKHGVLRGIYRRVASRRCCTNKQRRTVHRARIKADCPPKRWRRSPARALFRYGRRVEPPEI